MKLKAGDKLCYIDEGRVFLDWTAYRFTHRHFYEVLEVKEYPSGEYDIWVTHDEYQHGEKGARIEKGDAENFFMYIPKFRVTQEEYEGLEKIKKLGRLTHRELEIMHLMDDYVFDMVTGLLKMDFLRFTEALACGYSTKDEPQENIARWKAKEKEWDDELHALLENAKTKEDKR